MRIPRWIWRPGPVGSIALANLAGVGILGVLTLICFPDGVYDVNRETYMKMIYPFGLFLLAFPLGWLSGLVCPMSDPWFAVALVPMNAYFWGRVGAIEWERRIATARWLPFRVRSKLQRCWNPPDCKAQFAVELDQCPACGTPVPEQISHINFIPPGPSPLYVLFIGIVFPILIGGGATWIYSVGAKAVAIVPMLLAAWFIRTIIRRINRRDRRPPRWDAL